MGCLLKKPGLYPPDKIIKKRKSDVHQSYGKKYIPGPKSLCRLVTWQEKGPFCLGGAGIGGFMEMFIPLRYGGPMRTVPNLSGPSA